MGIVRKVLSDKYVDLVYGIFNQKQWPVQYEEGEVTEFERFCERLAVLENDEQRDLFLELTKDFLWVSIRDYEQLLCKAWKKFFESHRTKYNEKESLVICPLLSPEDFGKNKSGSMMIYACQGVFMRRFSTFSEEQIRICSTPEAIKDLQCKITELVIVDDFVGTGESALDCLDYIKKIEKEIQKITVLSLVAQYEGIKNVGREGVEVISAIEIGKGITDKYKDKDEREHKKEVMKRIEKSLDVPAGFELGYNESEALVSLVKTPNNTLPIYWHEKKNKRAPFPRKGNIKAVN